MHNLNKVIFFLTLSIGVQTISTQADEDIALRKQSYSSISLVSSSTLQQKTLLSKQPEIDEYDLSSTAVFSATDSDRYLMAQIVFSESRGEPYNGKVAVASVILNRVLDSKFPNSVNEVVFQRNAFSCVKNGTITVVPTQECFDAVNDAINGKDPTNKAIYFYNPNTATCNWMNSVSKQDKTQIGQHVFFKIN